MSCAVLVLRRSYVAQVQEYAAHHAVHWGAFLLFRTLPGIAYHLCIDQAEAPVVLCKGLEARILGDLESSHSVVGTEGRIGQRSREELC